MARRYESLGRIKTSRNGLKYGRFTPLLFIDDTKCEAFRNYLFQWMRCGEIVCYLQFFISEVEYTNQSHPFDKQYILFNELRLMQYLGGFLHVVSCPLRIAKFSALAKYIYRIQQTPSYTMILKWASCRGFSFFFTIFTMYAYWIHWCMSNAYNRVSVTIQCATNEIRKKFERKILLIHEGKKRNGSLSSFCKFVVHFL